MKEEDRESAIEYFNTFGQRMVAVPSKCDQAADSMQEASAEEQKAEAEHSQNVNTALRRDFPCKAWDLPKTYAGKLELIR
jgi:hypothetical protein